MITSPVKGVVQQKTSITVADKDSHVDYAVQGRNRGNDVRLRVGGMYRGHPLYEAYIHFNLTNKPSNLIKAELTLYIWSVEVTTNYTLSTTDENWDEMTIIWSNKPALLQTLGEITVSANDTYKIDLTSLINASTTISFCISKSAGDVFEDVISIASRNRAFDKPRIVWTYEETVPYEFPGFDVPFEITFLIIIIAGIIGVLIVVYILWRRDSRVNKLSLISKTTRMINYER